MIQSLAKKLRIFPFLLLCFLVSCVVKESWHSTTFIFFDTVCEVKVFCSSSKFKAAQDEVYRIFSDIEQHFSPEAKDYSSPVVLELFRKAKDIYRSSDGCFDITVAPLSRIWGFLNSSNYVPSHQEIKSILSRIGMEKIEEKNGALILLPGMELDWGGIAKGFGIDLASQSLMEMEIPKGFINAGGDLFCWGLNPDNKPWQIGIKHPRKSGFFGTLSITEVGATTTGDYQRFFEVNGIRYHHVFNPKTGYPARGKQSVTVIGPETAICDSLSTALFVSEEPEAILKKYPQYGAIIVDSEGKISLIGKDYSFRFID